MERFDLVVIGAGPAGLSAAIEASRSGMSTVVFDENARPGGQLFKQIHKFFGSKEHHAKTRGINIGTQLLAQAEEAGVDVRLNSVVTGIFRDKTVSVMSNGQASHYEANNIIVATGASERTLPFEGWTLPGVIGAGAAQTMMNLHRVKPGKKILMVGSGNVGLVVSYQLMQAGCEVVAVIDAAPKIGGYGVHASKIARMGVPFYLSHTIIKAWGNGSVEKVKIGKVDTDWSIITGTEKEFDVDTVCVAVGLNPMSQLLEAAGAKMTEDGGLVPVCDAYGATTVPWLFASGDVSGIEEASSAMIGGRISGLAAAKSSGYISEDKFNSEYEKFQKSLSQLRQGMFSVENRGKKLVLTDEGLKLSESLLEHGYIEESEIECFPGVVHGKGIHPVIECTQNIPCNPCQDACKFGCIAVGEKITALPEVVAGKECRNCGMCVAACSGQAIFLIDEEYDSDHALVTLPYEFLPLPKAGDVGAGLDRSGNKVCEATVLEVKYLFAFDKTALLTMIVPKDMAMKARFFKKEGGNANG